jgi:hypothetical protein
VVVEDLKAKTLKRVIRDEVEGTAHSMTDQMETGWQGVRPHRPRDQGDRAMAEDPERDEP